MKNSSITKLYNPGYCAYFVFEQQYNAKDGKQWFVEKWHYCFYYITVYLLLILAGQFIMKKRKPFDLRSCLTMWNIVLSAFSILAMIRIVPELYYVLTNFGFIYSICNSNNYDFPVTSFWSFLYLHSKVPELIDTAFIILRKRKLIFLHWFHHALTIFVCWFIASRPLGVSRWYTLMNLCVHSAMYTYFTLTALRIKVPKPIAMCITFTQIFQMIGGIIVTLWSYYIYKFYGECVADETRLFVVLFAYFLYLILFLKFFYSNYILCLVVHLKEK